MERLHDEFISFTYVRKYVTEAIALVTSLPHVQIVGYVVRNVLHFVILEIGERRSRPDPIRNFRHLALFSLQPEQPRQVEQDSLHKTIKLASQQLK